MGLLLLKEIRVLGASVISQSCGRQRREKWGKMRQLRSASKNPPCSKYGVDPALVSIVVRERKLIPEKPVQGRIEWCW